MSCWTAAEKYFCLQTAAQVAEQCVFTLLGNHSENCGGKVSLWSWECSGPPQHLRPHCQPGDLASGNQGSKARSCLLQGWPGTWAGPPACELGEIMRHLQWNKTDTPFRIPWDPSVSAQHLRKRSLSVTDREELWSCCYPEHRAVGAFTRTVPGESSGGSSPSLLP